MVVAGNTNFDIANVFSICIPTYIQFIAVLHIYSPWLHTSYTFTHFYLNIFIPIFIVIQSFIIA